MGQLPALAILDKSRHGGFRLNERFRQLTKLMRFSRAFLPGALGYGALLEGLFFSGRSVFNEPEPSLSHTQPRRAVCVTLCLVGPALCFGSVPPVLLVVPHDQPNQKDGVIAPQR
jgi:hypothetical protein